MAYDGMKMRDLAAVTRLAALARADEIKLAVLFPNIYNNAKFPRNSSPLISLKIRSRQVARKEDKSCNIFVACNYKMSLVKIRF